MNAGKAELVEFDKLQERLRVDLPELSVTVLPEVDSTNTWLLERCRADLATSAPQGSMAEASRQAALVVALHQTAGRGRHGRTWRSSPGSSLTFSLARQMVRDDLGGLSLAVGVLLAEFLDRLAAIRCTGDEPTKDPKIWLKWPNDLVAGPADAAGWRSKLGGILIETVSADQGRLVVIGVGLNLHSPNRTLGDAYGATSLSEVGVPWDFLADLAPMVSGLLSGLRAFEATGFSGFLERFSVRNALLGLHVQTGPTSGQSGEVMGISGGGSLLVRAPNPLSEWTEISSGEVSVRPDLSCG